ncbi:TIGR04063 family PEP-CTERM/XrtA system glycosyltransferase [Alteraurantiacibacter aquimixticola]|uniref:Glycosyltransferase, exosortase A system-associated n=1 Tax=Alteraurantiacibacter aquimixticola TaxID=2489173 RepID=A0A4T3EYL3_9SPHN|nr:TIGR04063 family PEP-CTERM/XrtA system glycosyltransferase [Alteraurantiacibacter aquimixticola]TIX48949.1 glycosyltransferase, exosortase A system-associated [Alteraurantiacibacter aquimixticola]
MTRVLHILDHSLPLHSGYAFRTRAIMHAQMKLGLDVRGITGLRHTKDGPDREEADGLTFHRTRGEISGPAGLREWREISALADAICALAQEWRPDVLHAHSPAMDGMAALRAGQRLGIPVVYEIRAFWEDAAVGNGTGSAGSLKYRLTRALENHVVGQADHVVTICEGLRTDLLARGFDAGKITIMPNGVDLSLFGNPVERGDALARALADELSLGTGPVIGFIGSFYDYEGLDDLVSSMPRLLERHPEARLLLVGGGPMAEAVEAQALASSARHAIRFTGRVPHEHVDRYYALTDIMAYPRKKSRLTDLVTPLKPLEAMAQGKLVAASDVGGHRELVTHARTGVLFTPDDPAACAAALADLLDRRGEWEAIRGAAREYVAEHRDWARNAERYQAVYQRVIGPVPTRHAGAAA